MAALGREKGFQRCEGVPRFTHTDLQDGAKQERLLQCLAAQLAAVDQLVSGLCNGVELLAVRGALLDRRRIAFRFVQSLLQGLEVVPGGRGAGRQGAAGRR